MSRSLNKVQLIGNVGIDPEVRTTAKGGRVANFTLATSRTWNTGGDGDRQEKTEWHRCVVWSNKSGGGLVNVVDDYVRKGERLYVEGRIEYRQWQDDNGQTKYSTEINVTDLILLGARKDIPAPVPTPAPESESEDDILAKAFRAVEDEQDQLPF